MNSVSVKCLSIFLIVVLHPILVYPSTIRDNTVTNTLAASDDGYSGSVPLGFSTNFLGYSNSALYVMNNGNVQFNLPPPPSNFEPTALSASNNRQIIAPFMGDVDTRLGAVANYGTTLIDNNSAFIVNWPGVGYFTAGITGFDKLNTFQLVLVDRSDIASGDFDIEFNYGSIQWDAASGSAVSAGFSDGLNPGTHYLISGSSVTGAFLDTNLSTGLIYVSNIDVPGRFLFLARNGLIITSPSMLTSIATTPYQKAVAGQLDKWQGTISGNFGDAVTQINALSSDDEKRNALERVGVSFISALADTGFKLGINAIDQIRIYLDQERDAPRDKCVSSVDTQKEDVPLSQAGKCPDKFSLTKRLDYFAYASNDLGEFKRTTNQINYHYHAFNITNGLDFKFTDDIIFGAAFDYGNMDSKFGDGRGDLNTKGYSGIFYAANRVFDNGYLNLIADYSRLVFDYQRDINVGTINTQADGRPRGQQLGLKLFGGYDFKNKKITWGPVAGLQYLDLSIDSYSESGAGNISMEIAKQKARSLIASFGGRINAEMDMRWIILSLNSRASFEHEFKDSARDVATRFSTTQDTSYDTRIDGPDRDYMRLGLGISGSMKDTLVLGIDYDTILANKQASTHRITASCLFKF